MWLFIIITLCVLDEACVHASQNILGHTHTHNKHARSIQMLLEIMLDRCNLHVQNHMEHKAPRTAQTNAERQNKCH